MDNVNNMKTAVERLIRDVESSEQHNGRDYRGFISIARRLGGKMPEEDPAATIEILTMLDRKFSAQTGFNLDLNDNTHSPDGLDRVERAAVITVSMYATSPRQAQEDGIRFGTAIGKLNRGDDTNIDSSFHAVIMDPDIESITYDIGRLIRRFDSPHVMDYTTLIGDLISLQSIEHADNVKVRWAKDFIVASEFK